MSVHIHHYTENGQYSLHKKKKKIVELVCMLFYTFHIKWSWSLRLSLIPVDKEFSEQDNILQEITKIYLNRLSGKRAQTFYEQGLSSLR